MRLVVISAGTNQRAGAEFGYKGYLPFIRKDGIDCLVTRVIDPASANSNPGRLQRILRRWSLRLLRKAQEFRARRFSRRLQSGDVLLALSIEAIEESPLVLDLVRNRDLRVLVWLNDEVAVENASNNHIARLYAATALVPDHTVARRAQQWFRDVQVVTGIQSVQKHEIEQNYGVLRRAFFPSIRIYGVFYKFINILEKTIESLVSNTDINVRIFVGENYSSQSEQNKRILKEYVDRGIVEGYVLFQENIYGSAFDYLYRHFFPPDSDEEIVVFTDLDLTLPANAGHWLRSMILKFRMFPEIAALSLDFDRVNWDPNLAPGHLVAKPTDWNSKYGINRVASGVWGLGLRKQFADEYLAGPNIFGDKFIFQYIRDKFLKKVYGRLPVYCRHLSWDAELTGENYISEKKESYINGVYTKHQCPKTEIYLKDTSDVLATCDG